MLLKNSLSTILLFSLFFVANAQNTFVGTITDESKIPVVNASVKLISASEMKGTLTDLIGVFEFKDLSNQNYRLVVSSVGYEKYEQNIVVSDSKQNLVIKLQSNTTELQSVEIVGRAKKDYNSDYSFSATKIAIKNKELPQALSTVTKELIADRGAFKLADAVKIASGVSPSSFYNQFNIRGISQN